MLQHPGVIGQGIHVAEVYFGQEVQRFLGGRGYGTELGEFPCGRCELARNFPCNPARLSLNHIAREQVGALAHGMAERRRGQKLDGL
jgi:hypothetical protein